MEARRRLKETARRTMVGGLMVATAGVLAGCLGDTSTGPGGGNVPVSVSVSVPGSFAMPQDPGTAFDVRVIDGMNELVMEEIDLVIGDLNLKPGEAASCGAGNCVEYLGQPSVLPLPTGGSALLLATQTVPVDRYDRLDLNLHVPGSGSPIVGDDPDLEGVSIRITGSYNDEPFTFEANLSTDVPMQLSPAVVLDSNSQSANVTFRVDVKSWFRAADGISLIDPQTANEGGENEALVESNILDSFEAFRDDDRDGSPGTSDSF